MCVVILPCPTPGCKIRDHTVPALFASKPFDHWVEDADGELLAVYSSVKHFAASRVAISQIDLNAPTAFDDWDDRMAAMGWSQETMAAMYLDVHHLVVACLRAAEAWQAAGHS